MLASVVQQSDSVIHIDVSILFQILFPFRLLQSIEQIALCGMVGPYWLSILNIAVYTFNYKTAFKGTYCPIHTTHLIKDTHVS